MRTTIQTQTKKQMDARDEAYKFTWKCGKLMAALIGIWGLFYLISELRTDSIGGLLRGAWIVITGS